jgi:hypothetical protein
VIEELQYCVKPFAAGSAARYYDTHGAFCHGRWILHESGEIVAADFFLQCPQ